MSLEIAALPGGIGAEVRGLDLSREVTQADREALNRAWLDAGILLFRGIGDSPEKQLMLSRVFGELEVHPIENIRVEGYPELIWLSNRKSSQTAPVYHYDGKATVGRIPWHTDLVYTTTPNRGALLRMLEMPAEGGETGWIDTAAAYDALPEATRARIENLKARFSFIADPREMLFGRPDVTRPDESTLEQEKAFYPDFPDTVHPLVWVHPVSGRKALCVSPLHLREVLGMEAAEGNALLEEMVAHATREEFSYVHRWEVNDMVLWDNLRTMHSAFGNPPEASRLVHRTTLKNEIAMGALMDEQARQTA